MNIAFNAVKSAIQTVIPNVLITTSELIGISQSIGSKIINYTIIPEDLASIPTVPELIIFELTEQYKDRYDFAKFYDSVVDDWSPLNIIKHEKNTNFPLNGDLITCVLSEVDPILLTTIDENIAGGIKTLISFSLNELIYSTWEYIPVSSSLGTRMANNASGMKIDFVVKTKEDNGRVNIDNYVDIIISTCFKNYMSFKIKDESTPTPLTIGNFKILNRPYVTKNQAEGSNIQSRTVTILGYYMVNYKN